MAGILAAKFSYMSRIKIIAIENPQEFKPRKKFAPTILIYIRASVE